MNALGNQHKQGETLQLRGVHKLFPKGRTLQKAWSEFSRNCPVRSGSSSLASQGLQCHDCGCHHQRRGWGNQCVQSANEHQPCRCSSITLPSSFCNQPKPFRRRGNWCLDLQVQLLRKMQSRDIRFHCKLIRRLLVGSALPSPDPSSSTHSFLVILLHEENVTTLLCACSLWR